MSSSDEEDGCDDDEDVDDWMFTTFTGTKKGGDKS